MPQKYYYKTVMQKIQHYPRDQLIICSDFIEAIDYSLDSSTPKRRQSTALCSLMLLEDFYDPWRCQHGTEKDFTFYLNSQRTYSRILTSKTLLQSISVSSIGVILWYDHASTSFIISLSPSNTSHELWRLNYSLLSDKQVGSTIRVYFALNTESVSNPITLWNAPKSVIRGTLLKLGAQERKKM